jgi:hypothetical protein
MLKQGCHKISFEEYLADPCLEPSLSRGCIPLLLDAPVKAWFNHPRLNPNQPEKDDKEEGKFDGGKGWHNLLFEDGKRIIEIKGYDNWQKNDAKELRKAAHNLGNIPLLSKQLDNISAMVESAIKQIRECEELGIEDLASEGDAELTYIWQEKNGVWCRIRPDWINKKRTLILDGKTTGTSVNPDEFSNHINQMDYPIQSVFYRRGVKKIDGVEADFVFVAQEDKPPYLCSFHGIDLMSEDMAKEKVEWAIKKWKQYTTSGYWPAYPKRVCYAEPKPWNIAEWEMKKSQMGDI